MTASSNTCDSHGPSDKRNCIGYAIQELFIGTATADGKFHDLIRHTPDQDQTMTYCSSVDPWHQPSDLDEQAGDQVGFDLFFTNGYTRGLPTMVPIAMLYGTPEDGAAQISYLEKRGYPISHLEMGEEPDGHYTLPEDYAALYIQFAAALHRVDTKLKRPDRTWSLLVVNKDQENPQIVHISFKDHSSNSVNTFTGPVTIKSFGRAQYQWHPHLNGGTADPDGPATSTTVNTDATSSFTLPAASVTVIRGNIKQFDSSAKSSH